MRFDLPAPHFHTYMKHRTHSVTLVVASRLIRRAHMYLYTIWNRIRVEIYSGAFRRDFTMRGNFQRIGGGDPGTGGMMPADSIAAPPDAVVIWVYRFSIDIQICQSKKRTIDSGGHCKVRRRYRVTFGVLGRCWGVLDESSRDCTKFIS
jgi:hypothetical protein